MPAEARTLRRRASALRGLALASAAAAVLVTSSCLSFDDAERLDAELLTLRQQIEVMEADDADGTPLSPADKALLTSLQQDERALIAYRNTYSRDRGPQQAIGWFPSLLSGDPRSIIELLGALLLGEVGRRKFKARQKAARTLAPTASTSALQQELNQQESDF